MDLMQFLAINEGTKCVGIWNMMIIVNFRCIKLWSMRVIGLIMKWDRKAHILELAQAVSSLSDGQYSAVYVLTLGHTRLSDMVKASVQTLFDWV